MRRAQRALEYRTPQLTARRRGRFDVVVCLRTDNTVLYDRLQKRAYSQKKITENIECEIMQVLLEEARESYDLNIVHEVRSDNVDDLENNVELIEKWCQQWNAARAAAAAATGATAAVGQ